MDSWMRSSVRTDDLNYLSLAVLAVARKTYNSITCLNNYDRCQKPNIIFYEILYYYGTLKIETIENL